MEDQNFGKHFKIRCCFIPFFVFCFLVKVTKKKCDFFFTENKQTGQLIFLFLVILTKKTRKTKNGMNQTNMCKWYFVIKIVPTSKEKKIVKFQAEGKELAIGVINHKTFCDLTKKG